MTTSNLFYHIFSADDGFAAILWNPDGHLTGIILPEKSRRKLEKAIAQKFPGASAGNPDLPAAELCRNIADYFAGKPFQCPALKIDFGNASPFSVEVYNELMRVQAGTTLSYKELGARIGKPEAARAVGRAVACNPLPLLVPCHRVIAQNGSIGGFSSNSGTTQKEKMLAIEGVQFNHGRICKPPAHSDEQVRKGIKHLSKVDPQLGNWIRRLPKFQLQSDNFSSPFQALLEAIVYQQLTGKAAATIFSRLLALFGAEKTVNPLDIVRAKDPELRKVGLSGQKILAVRDLAEKTLAGELPDLQKLQTMDDEKIISTLTKIRGIGRWTAEMLLIFKLGRIDVLAADDYGLKKGLAILRAKQNLPSSKELKDEGSIWQPFRTIACWYLWRIAESVSTR